MTQPVKSKTIHVQTNLKILLYIGDLPEPDEMPDDFDLMSHVAGTIAVDTYLRDIGDLAHAIAEAVEPFEVQPSLPNTVTI